MQNESKLSPQIYLWAQILLQNSWFKVKRKSSSAKCIEAKPANLFVGMKYKKLSRILRNLNQTVREMIASFILTLPGIVNI